MVGSSERRNGNRFMKDIPTLARGRRSTFCRARTCDFGEKGARLLVKEEAAPGSLFTLNFRLDSRHLICVQAEVVWSRAQAQDDLTEVGVSFTEGCRPDMVSLNGWLHRQMLLQRQAV